MALHPCLRRVGRRGASRVTGRRDGDFPVSQLLRLGNGGRETARLKGASWVIPFVFDPEMRKALGSTQALGFQERGPAFAKRHDVPWFFHRHHLVPSPDRSGTSRGAVPLQRPRVVARKKRSSAFFAQVQAAIPLELAAAFRADEMSESGEHEGEHTSGPGALGRGQG